MTTTLEHVQTFKILIIGDSNVGKSSLMTRFVHGIFNTQYIATIGVDFQIAIVNTGDYKCRLQIWFVYSEKSR
jgi:GTPase SAR1 family protein